MSLQAFTIIGGKKVAVPLKATDPDGDGLYKIATDTELGDVSIENVDIGLCEDDSNRASPLNNGDSSSLAVDKNGRLWIAGYNVFDLIEHAEDSVSTFTYNVDGDIEYLDIASAIINTLLGGNYTARRTYAYTGGVLQTITKSIEIGA